MHVQTNEIKIGQMFPNVILQDEQGRQTQIAAYRHRCNLVVAFSGRPISAGFQKLLAEMTAQYPEIQAEGAEVLVIIAGAHADLAKLKAGQDYPFPLLPDPQGAAHREAGAANTAGEPEFTVAVLDRYGEVYALYRVSEEAQPVGVKSLIEWLEYIELQCDE